MLNKELEYTLNSAFQSAKQLRYEYITVEHLLLHLLDNPAASNVLQGLGVDVNHVRQQLQMFIDQNTPRLPEDDLERDTQPTLGFQRVLQRAVFHVQSAGRTEVNGANVLAAIFSEQGCQAVYLLHQANITRYDVVNYISHGISKIDSPEGDDMASDFEDENTLDEPIGHNEPLEKYCINLNQRAAKGYIDPLIGRQDEVNRAIQILCRRRKNNPLLVGEAGVGKTAIAEGLAKLIVEGNIPQAMSNSVIYSLDLGALLAGTKYRGDFEKRLKDVLQQLTSKPHALLFIDEVHTIIGAGAASGGVMDASNLLKPLLANGQLKCIGATTYQEYRSIFEKDHALARRFQKIDIAEPSVEESFQILKGLKERFEAHHHVKFSIPSLHAAVELSARYLNERFLPDKAIDVVDEAGAYQNLLSPSKRKKMISVSEVERVVAKMARVPLQKVSATDKDVLRNLERDLKLMIYGQDKAIAVLSDAIKLARSGLREEQKPMGCFLFSGPTGVGKTEVTRQLAKILGIELLRFDMSEYMEKHSVSRLIGAPPGYVGFDQGGLLTEAVTKHPHAVLLLDEIEKAHPDIFNILLQVMDHGSLTDTNGRKADFRHVILVMTTNLGAAEMERPSVGFAKQEHADESLAVIKRQLSPEFRNRLDSIIQFAPLELETIELVVDKFLVELEAQVSPKGVTIDTDESARAWLAKHGYDKTMGARPMARLIEEKIKKPLANELLFGVLAKGGTLRIFAEDDELKIETEQMHDVC
jgi:ATP-dependent Clp protease ATP-binding subunit ClpA